MTRYNLVIREVDRHVFDSLKSNLKTVETRAATEKYQKIKEGDLLCFKCGQDILEKTVKHIRFFKSIDKMLQIYDPRVIMPFAASFSQDEIEKIYFGFPNYRGKIKKFGLVAFELM